MPQIDFESDSIQPWPVWAAKRNEHTGVMSETSYAIVHAVRTHVNNQKAEEECAVFLRLFRMLQGADPLEIQRALVHLYEAGDIGAVRALIQVSEQTQQIVLTDGAAHYHLLLPMLADPGIGTEIRTRQKERIRQALLGPIEGWWEADVPEQLEIGDQLHTIRELRCDWPQPDPAQAEGESPCPLGDFPQAFWIPVQVVIPDRLQQGDSALWWRREIYAAIGRNWIPTAVRIQGLWPPETVSWIDRPRPMSNAIQEGIREQERRNLRAAAGVAVSSGVGMAKIDIDAYVIERGERYLQLWITFGDSRQILYATTWSVFTSPANEVTRLCCTLQHVGFDIAGEVSLHHLHTQAKFCPDCGGPLFPAPNDIWVHAYGGKACLDRAN